MVTQDLPTLFKVSLEQLNSLISFLFILSFVIGEPGTPSSSLKNKFFVKRTAPVSSAPWYSKPFPSFLSFGEHGALFFKIYFCSLILFSVIQQYPFTIFVDHLFPSKGRTLMVLEACHYLNLMASQKTFLVTRLLRWHIQSILLLEMGGRFCH